MVARSKKDLASDELEQGLSHVGKALSLLGGRTRALSVKNNQRVFTVRKYLESIEQRLRVCQDLLQLSAAPSGSAPEGRMQPDELTPTRFPGVFTAKDGAIVTDFTPSQLKEALDKANEQNKSEEPRDDFERDYDSSREPGC